MCNVVWFIAIKINRKILEKTKNLYQCIPYPYPQTSSWTRIRWEIFKSWLSKIWFIMFTWLRFFLNIFVGIHVHDWIKRIMKMAIEVEHILSYWLFKNWNNSIIFQYATFIDKILMLRTLEKTNKYPFT